MTRKSKGYEVLVEYKGVKYRIAGKASDKATAETNKDLLVLMLQHSGVFSQGGRVPTMHQPKQKYYVPGLPVDVVNVPTDLRSRLAAAMQVGHPARLDQKRAQLAATACCYSVSGTVFYEQHVVDVCRCVTAGRAPSGSALVLPCEHTY